MKMKLFRYGYLIRYGFDLGRIFPIIIKQRGVSQLVCSITSEIVDFPMILRMYITSLNNQFVIIWSSFNLGL